MFTIRDFAHRQGRPLRRPLREGARTASVAEAFATKSRGFHDLEIDASDLRRHSGRNDGPDERGSDERRCMCETLLDLLNEWPVVAHR